MKSMTCRQMGGGCDTIITGETAEEMMENGGKHLRESQDPEDKKALEMMNQMQNDPQGSKKWQDEFTLKFDQLPQDQ